MWMRHVQPLLDSPSLGSLHAMFSQLLGCHYTNLCSLVWGSRLWPNYSRSPLCSLPQMRFVLPWLLLVWMLAFSQAYRFPDHRPPGGQGACLCSPLHPRFLRAAAGIGEGLTIGMNICVRPESCSKVKGKESVFCPHCFPAWASTFVLPVVFSRPSGLLKKKWPGGFKPIHAEKIKWNTFQAPGRSIMFVTG